MKTFIIAGILTLIAASAQAGLSTGPEQIETVRKTTVEANSAAKPVVKKVKKPHRRRREDDDDSININIDKD